MPIKEKPESERVTILKMSDVHNEHVRAIAKYRTLNIFFIKHPVIGFKTELKAILTNTRYYLVEIDNYVSWANDPHAPFAAKLLVDLIQPI